MKCSLSQGCLLAIRTACLLLLSSDPHKVHSVKSQKTLTSTGKSQKLHQPNLTSVNHTALHIVDCRQQGTTNSPPSTIKRLYNIFWIFASIFFGFWHFFVKSTYWALIYFWMDFRAVFSKRLTWAWEMPTSSDTSICVFPTK